MARVIAADLSTQLGTPDIAIAPLANFKPTYAVALNIQRFDSIKGQAVVVDAVWTVREIIVQGGRSPARRRARISIPSRPPIAASSPP